MSAALEVENLTVAYRNQSEPPTVVVKGVDLTLREGGILGLAGESGCGKSTAALSAIGFPIPGSLRMSGTARLAGVDLLSQPVSELRKVWGRQISYVAQDAALALNPLHRVDRLLREPLELHLNVRGPAVRDRSVELLDRVGIPEPDRALRRFPHQFSGGQQQRIALAIAMACHPTVLVLDEPTTGLDVTTQAQISRLIQELVQGSGTAALSISHDLALLATVCDEIAIMYAGEIVEQASASSIYNEARHPYASALVDTVPRIDDEAPTVGIPGLPPPRVIEESCAFAPRCRFVVERCRGEHPQLLAAAKGHDVRCLRADELGVIRSQRSSAALAGEAGTARGPILVVSELSCTYRGRHDTLAVDGVSLEVAAGETLAVVGESGSGKSTLLRAIAGLHAPDSGGVAFRGEALPPRAVKRSRELRQAIQIVFQNPHSSLNPRHTISGILERPLSLFRPDLGRTARRERVLELLAEMRLDPGVLARYPSQLSGGQKQRVALARAFAVEPVLILCDEVVSALDVSVQASILELLANLARERGTALLFVAHDLAVVRSIADRVCVMRTGRIHEEGATVRVFHQPSHPYTRELLDAVPRPEVRPTHSPRAEPADLGNSLGLYER